MPDFDAELHLRLTGERMLLGACQSPGAPWISTPITEAARALVAVGAISLDRAQAVSDDYNLATAIRSSHGFYSRAITPPPASAPATPRRLTPRRVVPCDRVIEQTTGSIHVRSVNLGDDATSLSVSLRPSVAPTRRSGPGGTMTRLVGGGPWSTGGPPSVTLGDDRGTRVTADFSGGGSDLEWTGRLESDAPLARDTAWIEVDGERLELVDRPVPVAVAVATLPPESPAVRYLWRRVATPDHFRRPPESLRPAIDALTAAGALSGEDPVIDDVHAVLEALQHGQSPASGVRRLPDAWRSLLARQGRTGGPTGTVVIGAVTPEFDGISVAAMSLESSDEAFEVDVEVAPGQSLHAPFDSTVDQPGLAWWALDDRGNHYLGALGHWSADDDHDRGTVGFSPALDPKARRLMLMPTAHTARAEISFPLPWATRPDVGADR